MRGRVVDADGHPIAGATVKLRVGRSSDGVHLGGLFGTTGPDGRFEMWGIPWESEATRVLVSYPVRRIRQGAEGDERTARAELVRVDARKPISKGAFDPEAGLWDVGEIRLGPPKVLIPRRGAPRG